VIDVDHHVNAVRRTVGNRTLEEGEVRVITISRSYPTDVTGRTQPPVEPTASHPLAHRRHQRHGLMAVRT
jgi:hypothetical protein